MTGAFEVRVAEAADAPFLATMLVEAANWHPSRNRPRELVLSDPHTARYVRDWPVAGDLGVIAVDEAGQPVGAAWSRFFSEDEPGYGFVGPDVPELAIGVLPAWRGRGVGRALLRRLHGLARHSGVRRMSLSVERANPAVRLYRLEGYRTVAAESDSDTMVVDLALALHSGRFSGGSSFPG